MPTVIRAIRGDRRSFSCPNAAELSRRVRGAGEWNRGLDLIEPDAGSRERVERRRGPGRRTVCADVIGAQGIDRDEQQVGMARRSRCRPPPGDPAHEAYRGDGYHHYARAAGHRSEIMAKNESRVALRAGISGILPAKPAY